MPNANVTQIVLTPNVTQIVLDGDSARTRRTDPITSHLAANDNDLHGSRSWVMFALLEEGPLAPFQLEHKGRKLWSPSRIRTALNELWKSGLVEPTGTYRRTRTGNEAQVWTVTQ